MRYLPLLVLFASGCVDRIAVAGITICPENTFPIDTSCLDIVAALRWFVSIALTLWLVNTISATRAAVDRIEKKLNAKPPVPPSVGG